MNILAVDPGLLTGYAWWVDGEVIHYGEADHRIFVQWASDRASAVDVVVCEDYVITPQTLKKTRQNYSLWQIGWIMYEFGTIRKTQVTLQLPSKAKTFADDEKLERLGWRHPTPGGHQDDAHRHLLAYLVDHHMIDLKELT